MDQGVILESIGPVFEFQAGCIKHRAYAPSNGAMWVFSKPNGIGSDGRSHLNLVTSIAEEVMDFGVASKFASTIEANATAMIVQLVVGNEGREEVKRQFFITTNGDSRSPRQVDQ